MQERDQRRLTRIIQRDRHAILQKIAADFNAINMCHCANHSTKRHRYGLSKPKAYSCALVDNTTHSLTPRLSPSTPTKDR
ncbi:hypothetical protein TNCV_982971 [Trichonephila clavipes]|nr:hypothetical protein TNCV_982971 [Trichonephila clavipes]